jgi:hypothetical protein
MLQKDSLSLLWVNTCKDCLYVSHKLFLALPHHWGVVNASRVVGDWEDPDCQLPTNKSKGSYVAPTLGFTSLQVELEKLHVGWNLHLHPLTNFWIKIPKLSPSFKGLAEEMMLVVKFELLPLTFERLLHWEHHWELREPYGNFKNPTQMLFTQWDEQSTPPNIQFSCAYDHTPSIHSTSATWPALCYCIQGLPFLLLLFPIHPHNQQLKQRTLLLNCIQQLLAIWWGSSAHCNVEFRLVLEVAFDEEASWAEYVGKLPVKWYIPTDRELVIWDISCPLSKLFFPHSGTSIFSAYLWPCCAPSCQHTTW